MASQLLAGEHVVWITLRNALADQALKVHVQVGDEALGGLFLSLDQTRRANATAAAS